MLNETYTTTKNYIYPTDPESRDDILAIDRKTKADAAVVHRVIVDRDWTCNTIATTVVTMMVRTMYAHISNNGVSVLLNSSDDTFEFYDLLDVAVSNKKNTKAEKTGNINVKFFAGSKVSEIITAEEFPERNTYIQPQIAYENPEKYDPKYIEIMKRIDNLARKDMKEKRELVLPTPWMCISTAYLFLENLYYHLVYKFQHSDKDSVMINFNDIIEFHVRAEEGVPKIYLRPGYGSKLIIKNDFLKEDDPEYEDDYE